MNSIGAKPKGESTAVSHAASETSLFLLNAALHAEAEPLMRQALTIDEQSYGENHPNVAAHLNNLAALLQDTNRLEEAEPLMRRALKIDEISFGQEHPNAETLPGLFVALRESLGLRLEPRKVSVEVLVIDHIERVPAEN